LYIRKKGMGQSTFVFKRPESDRIKGAKFDILSDLENESEIQ